MSYRVRRLLAPLVVMAALVSPVASSGCGSECHKFERRCRGNQLEVCEGDEVQHFVNRGCGADHCVVLPVDAEGLAQATCSTTGRPDPRCAGADGRFCADAQAVIACSGGYSVELPRCAAACVDARDDLGSVSYEAAFCSLSTVPAPACLGVAGSTCDGPDVVECFRGHILRRLPCVASTCRRERDSGRAYCTTDRPCDGPSETRCDGARMAGCVEGHVVDWQCPAGTSCRQYATPGPSSECF